MPSLPSERDFDPYGGGLDAQVAWSHFGGLTLAEANRRFRESPEIYQEDFAFMGCRAFAYYYPVIDSFLRETVEIPEPERGDREAWILAHCIQSQFNDERCGPVLRYLKPKVLALAEFVRENIFAFSNDSWALDDIGAAWRELQQRVAALRI